jgi:hypothetical protein
MKTHAGIFLERRARFNEALYGYRSATVVRECGKSIEWEGSWPRSPTAPPAASTDTP